MRDENENLKQIHKDKQKMEDTKHVEKFIHLKIEHENTRIELITYDKQKNKQKKVILY